MFHRQFHIFNPLLWAIVFIGTGCAHQAPQSAPAVVPVMPKIHVEAHREAERLVLESYTAQDLFDEASQLLRVGNCPEAIVRYEKLVSVFPESPLGSPALYNKGLCHDQLGQYTEAVTAYTKLVTDYPDSHDVKDALFRKGASLEKLEAFDKVVETMDTLLKERTDLNAVDEIEALTRKGSALIETKETVQAKFALESAIRIYTRDKRVDTTTPDYYYSMAQFKLAELTHNDMRAIALPPDDAQLGDILEKKCQLLLDAQHLYTKVIRIGHPHWAGAAAYRTGALYQHLWQDMLAAPAPEGMDDEQKGIYQEILRKRIKVLLEKAIKQWRRTLKFADRLHLDNHWIDSTRADLAHIEEVLAGEKEVGQDLPVP